MDALEMKVTDSLKKRGWCTEVKDGEEMIGYRPRTKKMIYGNLFHLCHDNEIDLILQNNSNE